MAYIQDSDHLMYNVKFPVYVSRQTYRKMGAVEARKLAKRTGQFARKMAKHLNVPKDMTIRIASIKKTTTQGTFSHYNKLVVLDPKAPSWSNYLDTLAHEMTHAEQYNEGRLSFDITTFKNIWKGEQFANANSFAKYFSQPWEIEARKYGYEVSQAILVDAGMFDEVGISYIAKTPGTVAKLEKVKK